MKVKKQILQILLGATLIAGGVAIPQTADALTVKTGKNCVWTVTGEDDAGNFIIGSSRCYNTYAEVLQSKGVEASLTATPATTNAATLALAGYIATHYDGTNYSGTSVSVEGTTCTGGGLNVPWDWNDRISSTQNSCGTIVHYENTNYGGSTAVTSGYGGNLSGYMDNRTSSIKYYA